jgi:hypothetical protein
MKHLLTGIALVIGLIGLAGPSAAKVVKFEILQTESPAFEGRTFGTVGTYDRIVARATIAVAPGDPHNLIIVDIDRPRNEQGLVEAVSDVEILGPTIAGTAIEASFLRYLIAAISFSTTFSTISASSMT